jgi:hypothetical protein
VGPQWISVDDKLPKEGEHVLVYFKYLLDNGICVGYHYKSEWSHWPLGGFAGDSCIFNITHWMTLPKNPKN